MSNPIINVEAISTKIAEREKEARAKAEAQVREPRRQLLSLLDVPSTVTESGSDDEKIRRLADYVTKVGKLMAECNILDRLDIKGDDGFADLLALLKCGDANIVAQDLTRVNNCGKDGNTALRSVFYSLIGSGMSKDSRLKQEVVRLFAEDDAKANTGQSGASQADEREKDQGTATNGTPKTPRKQKARKEKTIEERMKEKITKVPEALLWTITQWTECLGRSRAGIHRTSTWRIDCAKAKAEAKAQRMLQQVSQSGRNKRN